MRFQTKFLNVVNYFGIVLYLPKFVRYVATDEDGTITGYASRPKVNEHGHCFSVDAHQLEDYTTNGYIPFIRLDFEEGNWRESCISVQQLLWKISHDS